MNFLLGFGIVALVLLSLFIILIVLMQRPSANAGMGSTLGGSAAEQAFGSDTGNILTKATVWGTIIFFVLCMGLFLGTQKRVASENKANQSLSPNEEASVTPDSSLSVQPQPANSGISADSASPTSGIKASTAGASAATGGSN
jgi:preprotein translocase subunit SecG